MEPLDVNSFPNSANFEEITDIELLFNSDINGYNINPMVQYLTNDQIKKFTQVFYHYD